MNKHLPLNTNIQLLVFSLIHMEIHHFEDLLPAGNGQCVVSMEGWECERLPAGVWLQYRISSPLGFPQMFHSLSGFIFLLRYAKCHELCAIPITYSLIHVSISQV